MSTAAAYVERHHHIDELTNICKPKSHLITARLLTEIDKIFKTSLTSIFFQTIIKERIALILKCKKCNFCKPNNDEHCNSCFICPGENNQTKDRITINSIQQIYCNRAIPTEVSGSKIISGNIKPAFDFIFEVQGACADCGRSFCLVTSLNSIGMPYLVKIRM